MPIFLEGISLAFFRGVGSEVQDIGPFKDFNFFVGANNAGKSTVLDAIHRYFGTEREPSFSALDAYTGQKTGQIRIRPGVLKETFEAPVLQALEPRASRSRFNVAGLIDRAQRICRRLADKNGLIWYQSPNEVELASVRDAMPPGEWQQVWGTLTGGGGGSLEQHWIPQTLNFFFEPQKVKPRPRSRFVLTHRQIGRASEQFADFSGRGLIDRLAELQSPDHDKRPELELFQKINEFLETVTGKVGAKIEIPHNRNHVLVHMDDKVLPLANLGTGIHEVVMLAAFCTIAEQQIVCIEEPESHLHPLLQRKLIAYLKDKTSNQYFIATHSAAFIDTPGAALFHVTNDGVQTRITETVLRKERYAVCNDLGVRASDLVQSNFVVWVEGPSDRLYLKEWIASVDPDLKEGIHYSIMFYGGRLLSHLSAEDDEVTEFINLRSLNQNLCVIMDSDKSSADNDINATKRRILDELTDGHGMTWVTQGREIENYLPPVKLEEAIKAIYSARYHAPGPRGDYERVLQFYPKTDGGTRSTKLYTDADKVKVAHELIRRGLDTDILDLKERLTELVARIEKSNN